MDEGFHFLDIIFLAMIAAFIALRLRSVLGRRTGHERRPAEPFAADDDSQVQDNVIRLPGADDRPESEDGPEFGPDIAPDSPLGRTFRRIAAADRSFHPADFIKGARAAYGVIIEAFAAGDRDTLKPLLGEDVFEQFDQAISSREAASRTTETRVIEITAADFDRADLSGTTAEITVTFEADLLTVTRDDKGVIVDGNPSDAEHVRELWTFSRDIRDRDPNWALVATQSGD